MGGQRHVCGAVRGMRGPDPLSPALIVGANGWHPVPDPALFARVRAEGLMVDTAAVYGRGRCSAVIGEHLPAAPVITKIMPWLWPSAAHFRRTLARSLRRLRRPRVDLLLLHFPSPRAQPRWLDALAAAVHDGHAAAVGLSNHDPTQLVSALDHLESAGAPARMVQAEVGPLRADALWDGRRTICQERGIELAAFRVLGGGKLFSSPPPGAAALLAEARRRTGATPVQSCIAWVRHHGARPIIGTRSATHLDEALGAERVRLPDDLRLRLDALSRGPRARRRRWAPG